MLTMMPAATVILSEEADFAFPQREAAFFYGLFLRGHSADELRRDIEVPPTILAKWHRDAEREPDLRGTARVRASGTVEVSQDHAHQTHFAVTDLNGEASAKNGYQL